MKSIDYLWKTYSPYFAFPLNNKIDPGFIKGPIFEMKYNNFQTTSDKKYLVPDFVNSISHRDCSLNV